MNCLFRLVFEQMRLLYIHVYQKFMPTLRSSLNSVQITELESDPCFSVIQLWLYARVAVYEISGEQRGTSRCCIVSLGHTHKCTVRGSGCKPIPDFYRWNVTHHVRLRNIL